MDSALCSNAAFGTGIETGVVVDVNLQWQQWIRSREWSCGHRLPRTTLRLRERGCIEALAARPAIGARARAKLAAEPFRRSAILDLANGNLASVTSELVAQAYAAGDPSAGEILHVTVELITLAGKHHRSAGSRLLDPDVIVTGGGVAATLKPFVDEIKERYLLHGA